MYRVVGEMPCVGVSSSIDDETLDRQNARLGLSLNNLLPMIYR